MRSRLFGNFRRPTNFLPQIRQRFTESEYGFGAGFGEVFPEATQSSFWMKAGLWAIGSVAMFAGYEIYQNDQRMNRILPTLPEMHEFEEALENAFAEANDHGVVVCSQFKSLLEMIELNNRKKAKEYLKKLQKLDAKFTSRIRDNLIVYTANHGKVYMLEMLANMFGEKVVRRNRIADRLLNLQTRPKSKDAKEVLEQLYVDTTHSKSEISRFHSLLNAIEIDDATHTQELAKDLNLTADTAENKKILDNLISYTANLAKVNALKALKDAYGEDRVINNPVARDLLAHSNKEAVRGLQDKILTRCDMYFKNDSQNVIRANFRALLQAIKQDDAKMVHKFFDFMTRLEHKGIKSRMPAYLSDELIEFAASLGKVKTLQCLAKILGPDTVRHNPTALALLNFAESRKERYNRLSEQFYQSPGKIRFDGAVAYVAVMQPEILAQHIQYRISIPVFTLDPEVDAMAALEYQKQVAAIKDEMREKFELTAVIDTFDGEEAAKEFEEHGKKIIARSKDTGRTVVGTYVFTGGHYSVQQVLASYYGPESNHHSTHVYIDPKGVTSSINTCDFRYFTDALTHGYGQNAELFVSEERVQFAGAGCSLFALHHWEELMSFDAVFAANTQYEFAGKPNAIFAYARHHQQSTYGYGYNRVKSVEDDYDYDAYEHIKTFNTFLLPAVLTIQKQSFNSDGAINDMPDVYTLDEDNAYRYELGSPRVIKMQGALGIHHSRLFTSKERAQEFDKPANIQGDKTVNQAIADGTEKHQGVKERNALNRNWSYEAGNRMSRYVRNFD